ncbi:uncharacterized protein LOC133182805 [Saccostrea echinata]|uniref:uncharacterized protein LOC133182805 n=1 Tax=Saccostrea echinata TaxID=191078 RepID=UPI002A83260C|nr:uncharacterized protein LOC133182805 [Saccostrea echinata]
MKQEMAGTARRVIYVYKGLGALEENCKVLMSQLMRFVNPCVHAIQFISPEETIIGSWCDTAALYVIGGGYDLGLIEALGPAGMNKIQEYVHHGGSYLGICSGAYFACSYIEFDKGGPLEVCGDRQLKFYPGGKIGPLYGPYKYNSDFGSRAASLKCHIPQPVKLTNDAPWSNSPIGTKNGFKSHKMEEFYAYFSGGGFFYPYPKGSFETAKVLDSYHTNNGIHGEEQTYFIELVKSDIHTSVNSCPEDQQCKPTSSNQCQERDVEVLCTYSELKGEPAAIVKCKVGKGQAVLSSVHIEYDSQCLDIKDVYLKPIIESLKNFDFEQSIMFRYMLKCLGVSINLDDKHKV